MISYVKHVNNNSETNVVNIDIFFSKYLKYFNNLKFN